MQFLYNIINTHQRFETLLVSSSSCFPELQVQCPLLCWRSSYVVGLLCWKKQGW